MLAAPRGERRSADVIGCAVACLSVGDDLETPNRSGHVGVQARVENSIAERRQEIARKAADFRWT